ncbi:hypothetical protein [Chroococcidiopsis sp.]|uniref:hypothetical protein n=1 Tax=Chroococcidiopsis sp. TaxID=3088168 RepID=UPI003F2B955A
MQASIQPSSPQPIQPMPNNYFPTVEGSVLATLALFLIRGLWQQYLKNEEMEARIIQKLLDERQNRNDSNK